MPRHIDEDGFRQRYTKLAEAGVVGILVTDDAGKVIESNDAFLAMVGYDRADIDAGRINLITMTPPEWLSFHETAMRGLIASGIAAPRGKEYIRKDGQRVPTLVSSTALGDGTFIHVVSDLTERKRAEEALKRTEAQLLQSQKMEALGRLAGGVAHDFNNLLSVILSYGELIKEDLEPSAAMHADIDEILKAAGRATTFTKQLLMFSRQQVLEPRPLDLNAALASSRRMLQSLLGEDIHLDILPGADVGRIFADAVQVEQVIMNLVVNARDAMPSGGKITIETQDVLLSAYDVRENPIAKAGPHVMLAVSDTGSGMDETTRARIFEPFFTTKEKGKGTGLGLSTVFGIIQNSGGSIVVESQLGKGTTFEIFMPEVAAALDNARPLVTPTTLRGTETVLLVEDQEQVLGVTKNILHRQGYSVLAAQNAGEALLLCEKHAETLHLLLTDVVMPQISGPALATRLARLHPEMRVLFMSGYADDSLDRHGVVEGSVAFLQKPFTPDSLARKVREVLDNR